MNEPAFPNGNQRDHEPNSGMTLRDYFAAAALRGLMANHNVIGHNPNCGWDYVNCTDDIVAACCYAQADAMLKARESQEAPHTPTEAK